MMALGFRVARWLEWSGEWNGPIPFLPISKIRFCEICIVAGSIMSVSVGPWLAAACGAVTVSVCRARNRKRAVVSLILLVALLGEPIYGSFKKFVSVNPDVAQAAGERLQEDAAYRNKLIPLYTPVVEERPAWGWGRNAVPVLEGMASIDNAYLAVALTYGLYAMGMLVALFIWPPIRLAIFSFPLNRNDPRALAAFSMIGIYVLNAVVDCTGSGGGPPWRFLFIIAGWSTALLVQPTPRVVEQGVKSWPPQTQIGFRRVMM
jgi:hypothetical protein